MLTFVDLNMVLIFLKLAARAAHYGRSRLCFCGGGIRDASCS